MAAEAKTPQWQVEQYSRGCRHKCRCRFPLGRLLRPFRQEHLYLIKGKAGVLDLVEREVGVGVDQTGGQLCAHIGAGEVGPRRPCRFLRLAGEVVILRRSDVPLGAGLHGPYRGHARARLEGGVHQGHQAGTVQKAWGRGPRLLSDRTGVLGLFRSGLRGPIFSLSLAR